MTWAVRWEPPAEKDLASVDKPIRKRILAAVGKLAEDPHPPGSRLVLTQGVWRIRVGDYRVKYDIIDGELVVVVIEVVHRSKAY
ncbi:type II toxin-antitoxin system RelE/ParE family toxin [Micromonospora sp. NPDC048986]|uniref:type II toxin-antitoxin system RelE family toxin n=1 Tax=Micromonospora sp. NPDC048986 TaxID=3155644 RepID=UPI0034047372